MRLEDLVMIFYQWVQGGLLFQPVPEVRQNLEALVVRWVLEVLCLRLLKNPQK